MVQSFSRFLVLSWEDAKDWLTSVIGAIFSLIPKIIYLLCTMMLSLCDVVQLLFRKLAGLDTYYVVSSTDSSLVDEKSGDLIYQLLRRVFLEEGTLNDIFWGMVVIGITLLFLSTLVAVIRSQYMAEDAKSGADLFKKLLANLLKGVVSIVVIPATCIFGVYLGNAILKAIEGATSPSTTLSAEQASVLQESKVGSVYMFNDEKNWSGSADTNSTELTSTTVTYKKSKTVYRKKDSSTFEGASILTESEYTDLSKADRENYEVQEPDNSVIQRTQYIQLSSDEQKAYEQVVTKKNSVGTLINYDIFGIAYVGCRYTPFSGTVFKASASRANRVRTETAFSEYMYENREKVTTDDDSDSNKRTCNFGLFVGDTTEEIAQTIDDSFANCYRLKSENFAYLDLKLSVEFKNGLTNIVGNIDPTAVTLFTPVTTFSKYNVGLVWYYYDLWKFDYFLAIGSLVTILVVMLTICLGLAKRLFELVGLAIASPAICGIMPLDNGEALKKWRQQFVKKTISAYASVFALNLCYVFLAEFENIKFFNVTLIDYVVTSLFNIAVLISVKSLIATLSEVIGAEDAHKAGDDVGKEFGSALQRTSQIGVGLASAGVAGYKAWGKTKNFAREKLAKGADWIGDKIQEKNETSATYKKDGRGFRGLATALRYRNDAKNSIKKGLNFVKNEFEGSNFYKSRLKGRDDRIKATRAYKYATRVKDFFSADKRYNANHGDDVMNEAFEKDAASKGLELQDIFEDLMSKSQNGTITHVEGEQLKKLRDKYSLTTSWNQNSFKTAYRDEWNKSDYATTLKSQLSSKKAYRALHFNTEKANSLGLDGGFIDIKTGTPDGGSLLNRIQSAFAKGNERIGTFGHNATTDEGKAIQSAMWRLWHNANVAIGDASGMMFGSNNGSKITEGIESMKKEGIGAFTKMKTLFNDDGSLRDVSGRKTLHDTAGQAQQKQHAQSMEAQGKTNELLTELLKQLKSKK